MRNQRALVFVTGGIAAAALTLAACSSSGGGNSGSNTPGGNGSSPGAASGQAAGACKLTSPPTSSAQAPSGSSNLTASGKVGVILPDTTSSTRYTLYDAPLLTQALSAAGITPDVQNSQGSTSKQAS